MNVTKAAGGEGVPPEINQTVRPDLLSFITDQNLALLAPIVVYWSFSMLFYTIDRLELFEKYRIHTPEELLKRNRCSVAEVIRAVVLQHAVQTLVGLVLNYYEPPQYTGFEEYEIWNLSTKLNVATSTATFIYYWVVPTFKILLGFFIMDTWQYTLHRIMHNNKFLYKHLHSVHHRLYVPYAFGALYNSLIEGFLLDTLGAGISYLLTGMTTRESIIFFTFSTMKTVDDHCGYDLPFDPFQLLFPNNAVYHDIHHQSFGIKTNFSQPFFIHWDALFNTQYKNTKAYAAQQKQKRLQRYNELQKQKLQKKED
ncbi:hypothetical protein TRICI_003578 [Trichomonascus ciferrii]|uniref:Fatty acid hydroxylase domain-containing protein n=1 Tax=Trichomonascus ciferrii TaxID=44093 RepID=A0A642V2S6_9ASCO|nr:hypothetical protein TRICI_003578 [Trichomonascus ciferrii]